MKSIEDLRLQLVKNKLMRTQEEVELFESAMNELYKEPNLNNIDYFCEAFNDATEHHEVMFGLVHGIENYCKLFGVDNYFDKLVDALAKMDNNSIGWQNIIFYRILNTDWGRKALADKLKQKNDDIRNFILCAINRIKQEDNARFGYKADEILNTF